MHFNRQKVHCIEMGAVRYSAMGESRPREGVSKTMVRTSIFAFLVMSAGCTDLKPLEARIDELQSQVNKLQGDIAKSASNAAAANKATAASASAASNDAKQALSIAEANTAAIEKLNAKIDQMFKRRPAE
jgi:outer membrane murein-binding lipoprotein Lpp